MIEQYLGISTDKLGKAGWITLNPDVEPSTVTQDDIAANPYNIEFTEMSSTNIPGVLDDQLHQFPMPIH